MASRWWKTGSTRTRGNGLRGVHGGSSKANRVRSSRVGAGRIRLEGLEPRQLLASDLRIVEVMTDNRDTIKDDDGVTSDWLELYNAGNESVNLTGYHLTDDLSDRTKWTFSGGSLDPGSSLIVWASGKDRRDADEPLHTNFRLAAGNYLALYQPDGRTVEDVYTTLPVQYEDISYGIGQTLVDRPLVTAGSSMQVLLPDSAAKDVPTATWTSPAYNATSWSQLTSAIGYDADTTDGDFNPLIAAGGNVGSMRGKTGSAYTRSEFTLPDVLPTYKSLDLTLNYDDGYIAYLNGTEISRANAPEGAAAWNSLATSTHGGIAELRRYANFTSADDRDDFNLKGNAVWNNGRLQLTGATANQTSAAWTISPVKFGSDYTFEASMVYDIHSPGPANTLPDGDGLGGEGMTFVLQGTNENLLGQGGGGLGLEGSGAVFLAIELDSVAGGAFDPDTTLPSHLGVTTSEVGNVARVAVPRFNGNAFFPGQPGPGVNLIYLWVGYKGETKQLDVYMSTTPTKPATPTLTTTVDLSELFGELTELYTGWTATTSTAYNAHEVLSFDMTTGVGELGREAVTLDVSQYVSLLRPGKNVLAIHGLNTTADDEDFLLVPQLKTQEITLGDTGYFLTATPSELNGPSSLAPSGNVTFSRDSALFIDPFSVEITPPAAGATIYYTTDGTIPTEASLVYNGPIAVNGPMRIRARAMESGRSLGPITTVGYTQLDESLSKFENDQVFQSNLPLMIFDGFGLNPDTQTLRMVPTVATLIDPGADGVATLLDTPYYTGRAGLRSRGQSSEGWPKKQYALEFWEEGNDDSKVINTADARDKDIPVFGLPEDSDWVLNGPYSDKTQLNNYLTFNWYREMGLYAPRAKLVEVFVQTRRDGKLNFSQSYRGTYVLLEKIKISNDRVDIAEIEPGDNAGSAITGGYMWKKDKSGANDIAWNSTKNPDLRIVEPQKPRKATDIQKGEITPEQLAWIKAYINEFEAVLYGPNFADPKDGYAKYIDIDSWVDTWLMVEMTKNIDGFRLSTYYHKDRDGKIKQGPAWDYNLSLGNGNYLKGAYPEGWYKDGLDANTYPYWGRLFEDPNFAQKVADRWQELRSTIFTTQNMMADIDAALNLISNGNPNLSKPAAGEPSNPISRNYARWTNGGYGESIYHWPNCFFGVDDCPASPLPAANTPNGRPNSYDDYIYIMKWFLTNRMEWMDKQFTAPVTASPAGGVVEAGTKVTLSGPAGYDIYYTVDGTDPRDPLIVKEETIAIAAGSTGKMFVPKDGTLMGFCDDGLRLPNATSCFVNPDYVEGTSGDNWTNVSLPIGFDEAGGAYNDILKTNVSAAMQDVNSSAYIRIPFTVDATTLRNATSIKLRTRHDDGFVAYLWHRTLRTPSEIGRANAEGKVSFPITALPYNSAATQTHPDEQAVAWSVFDTPTITGLLREGTNYLVIQLLNENVANTDLLLDIELIIGTQRSELSPSIIKYEGPITIDKNTRLIARGLDAQKRWSGRGMANYVVNAPVLAVTELNYNPHEPTPLELAANSQLDNDDFEFIELKNIGSKSTNLIGLTFTGIDLSLGNVELAPGEMGVVVQNEAAFRLRYGDGAKILGEFFGGGLANNGERITISDSLKNTIVDFSYSDSAIWPRTADGGGATLELRDPNFTSGDQYSKYYVWRGSTEYGGSPGRDGAGPGGVVINEVLANPETGGIRDSIELLNITNAPIVIGGWYLTDSASEMKYQIPLGTVIGPGQYLIFDERQFNANPDTGFGLSGSNGESLWLLSATNDKIDRIMDYVEFGASLPGETFGRIPDGTGRLTPLDLIQLGARNTVPRVGPVIISEFNYNPGEPTAADLAIDPLLTSGDLEFIEIHNPTQQAVSLEDWRIRGGVEFNFLPNDSLAAGETAVVLRFNPTTPENANRMAAFRAHYQLGNNVKLFGGYTGQLSGNGERINLQRPDLSAIGQGVLPRVIEDEVVFDDRAPWPESADGQGRSLHRIGTGVFGSDADSWSGLNPTPGVATFASVPGDFDRNGLVDVADISMLFAQLRLPTPDPNYDLNSDRLVNVGDRDYMIHSILDTNYGDADLDGTFDSQDLIMVFQSGGYESATASNLTWAQGDWNGDGKFDTSDLTLAAQSGAYVPDRNAAPQGARLANPIAVGDLMAALDADLLMASLEDPDADGDSDADTNGIDEALLALLAD